MPFSAAGLDFDCRPAQARRFQRSSEFDLLLTIPATLPVLLRSFTKASKTLLTPVNTASEMIEKGLLCGGERRKRSMAARMDLKDVFL